MPLEDELYQIYVAQVYKVLADNDPAYQLSLLKAGAGWNGTGDIPPGKRSAFEGQMKLQAWLGATQIAEARSLLPQSIRTKVLTGPQTLYRVADSSSPKGRPGIWWFSEKVARRCREAAGADPKARLEWLRNVLAVCFNWSKFDCIERFTLHGGELIPAVLGIGLPMPFNRLDPFVDRTTGATVVHTPPPDYWRNIGKMLLGGESQIVLPWIPVRRVTTSPSL